MMELQTTRKNKIHLADYDYQDDIKIRLLLAHFTEIDLEVLEEILYNPLEFPLDQLLQNLSRKEQDILPSLDKLTESGLLERSHQLVVVNKEKRKYFELELEKFDEDFEPGMEFVQNLLKRIPIQVLPNWYHIPRHCNNIFQSIVEKYLITPQIFQRYFSDLQLSHDLLGQIASDVFASPEQVLSATVIKRKYHLSEPEFEELVLLLEFHFLCCLSYRKQEEEWEEVLTPFQEWKEYLQFLQSSLPETQACRDIVHLRSDEYGFSKDISEILMHIDREPTHFTFKANKWHLDPKIAPFLVADFPSHHSIKLPSFSTYVDKLIEKSLLLGFVAKQSSHLVLTEAGFEWLEMGREEKAMAIFKHPFHQVKSFDMHSDRNIHEIENSLSRIANLGWVLFEDFFKGSTVALKEEKKVRLKKEGRKWHYAIPTYSDEERQYIEAVMLGYLFESGIVRLGLFGSDIAFRITELGCSLFETP